MSKLVVVDHPLVQHKLSLMRRKETSTAEFRRLVKEIALLLGYEICRDLPTEEVEVETPLEVTKVRMLAGKKLCLVSVLRAGNGLLEGMLDLIPSARVGHVGLYRDPATLKPVEYYYKVPSDIADRQVILVDPMLATANSAIAAVQKVKDSGATEIKYACLLAAPEGVKKFHDAHPDVPIFTAAQDRQLNDHGYIMPGLGDAGDRIYGTR
ncbi:uracil phosphoribosyltransferase [Geminicoccus roseus]|uniref:uracil phosphoribosyltransferase n=1 Tax=Geminicoccus roseus TaxID=404900 RepID=UPI0004070C0F|nr:uracil phosphoribosyltransferase [Geminicoccus roseus]